MLETHAPSLAAWLGLDADVDAEALPRTLRADLARAALADGQPGLALALTGPAVDDAGPLWASDAAAEALLALGRAAEALACVEARLARAPAIAPSRLRAEALLALGEREQALAAARELVARQPDAVSAWSALGDVALAAGELDEAAAAYARARELSPRGTAALVGEVRVVLARGDAAAASALLEPLSEEESPAVLAVLAEAATAAGDHTRAAAIRGRLDERRAALRAGWRSRVEALLGRGDASDAELPDARGASPTSAPPAAASSQVPPAVPATPQTGDAHSPQDGAVADGQHGLLAAETPASPALLAALREHFDFDEFRPGQAAVCQAMLDGRDTLAVMPTGAGKSLCFQLPAMLLDGVTLVVSPLVALMKDQLDGLPPSVYERATLLNSTLEPAELARRQEALAAGQYRLVYVAPERLGQPTLLAALRRAGVARVVVDEAHCVSAWGHDFRPDYLTIGDALGRLGDPPLLAVTATASPAVRADIGAGLGRALAVLQTPLFRANLRYEVQSLPNVEAKMEALVELCRAEPGSAVVYVNSRQRTEELARLLRNHGVRAAHYHAGLAPDERNRVQDAFMLDRTRVIVATVAFGMGVDKANIRLVVHFSLPESLEAYVQESGRAGRDGRPARCVLLTAPADKASLTRWLKAERLSLDDLRAVYRRVKQLLGAEDEGLIDDRQASAALAGEEGAETRGRVALGLLERAGLLERLGAQQRGRVVRLVPPPADATARLETLLREYAEHQDRGLAAIVDYAESLGCRHARIARHFGQRLDPPCGACDRCAPPEREVADGWQPTGEGRQTTARPAARPTPAEPTGPSMAPAAAIFGCLSELPFTPGRRGLVQILLGSVAASVGADRTAYHGALRGLTASAVERVVDRLVAEGYLDRTPARTRDGREYTALSLTPRGRAGPPDWDRLPATAAPARSRGAGSASVPGQAGLAAGQPPGPEPDPDRFERLRAWRRQEAAASGIAPFMVFPDSTLRALAALPAESIDRDTLALVPGIGPAKLDRYGDALVAILRDDLSDDPDGDTAVDFAE